jgi:hypothetical protein
MQIVANNHHHKTCSRTILLKEHPTKYAPHYKSLILMSLFYLFTAHAMEQEQAIDHIDGQTVEMALLSQDQTQLGQRHARARSSSDFMAQQQTAQPRQCHTPDTAQAIGILDLPAPVFDDNIAPLLPLQALGRLRQTCRGLRNVWDHHRILDFEQYPSRLFPFYHPTYENSFNRVLLKKIYDTNPPQELQWLDRITKIATLGYCGGYTLAKGLVELHRKLTELKLGNNIKITIFDDCGFGSIESAASIVFPTNIQPLLQRLQRLRSVDLRGGETCSYDSLASIYTSFSNVPILILRCYGCTPNQLAVLKQKMPRTKIYIQENRRISLIN